MEWNQKTESVAIDCETMGLRRSDFPFAVSLCDDIGNNILFEWSVNPKTRKPKVPKKDIKEIKSICHGKKLIFFNQNYDIQKLTMIRCHLSWRKNTYDVGNLSHLVDSETHSKLRSLKPLAKFYLDIDNDDQIDLRKAVTKSRIIAKRLGWNIAQKEGNSEDHLYRDYWVPRAIAKHEGYAFDHPFWHLAAKYANLDTTRTMLMYLLFMSQIEQWSSDDPRLKLLERGRQLANVLYDMAAKGLSIFPQKILPEIEELKGVTSRSVKIMQKVIGPDFNINSNKQKPIALFDILRFTPTKETDASTDDNRKWSTDKEVRADILEQVALTKNKKTKLYKRCKKFTDAWDDYEMMITSLKYLKRIDAAREGDTLYATINQVGAATTRVSSDFQNLKKAGEREGREIRGLGGVFGPRPGRMWLCLDYAQLQLRIFAYLAGEKSMIEAFKKGYDFHAFVASKIFDKPIDEITSLERRIAKNVNFGFIFGASPRKIEATAGMVGLWDIVVQLFPSAHDYMEKVKSQVRRDKYITTPHGYRLYVNQPHKGVNYEVQGCEGDIVKYAMVDCEDYLSDLQAEGYTGFMAFQKHDELIFDLPSFSPLKTKDYKKQLKKQKLIVSNLIHLMEKPGLDVGMVTPVDAEYTVTNLDEVKKYSLVS